VLASLTPARMRRALPLAAGALVALTVASILVIDRPLARYLAEHGHGWRPVWNDGLAVVEAATLLDVWKWAAGATLIAIGAILVAIPRTRSAGWACWFVAAVHLVSRIGGNQLKAVFGRLRPSEWIDHGGATFFADGGIALPSGHVAHFLGLILPLAVLRPRIGVPLLIVPVLVGWARVATNAHFLADVLAGAAWTTLITWLLALAFRIGARPTPADRSR
jgi:membrane-associated phospholipid phosphatase